VVKKSKATGSGHGAWVEEIQALIRKAIDDKGNISKEELADGLDDVAEYANGWAEQMRTELQEENK